MRARHELSTWGGLVAILLWSSTIAFTRHLTEQLGPLTAGACVYGLGAALSFANRRGTGKGALGGSPPRNQWACGSLFVLYTVLLYGAISSAKGRAQVLEVGLLNYLWPAFTLLLSIPLLRTRADIWIVPGTLIALSGVFLVMTQGTALSWSSCSDHFQSNPIAFSMAFLAAVSWALYSNLARRWSHPGASGAVEWFMAATGALLLVGRLLVREKSIWSAGALVEAASLGAITAVAYALWDRAMRQGNWVLVAVTSYLTPLFSTVISCLYLRVPVGAKMWAGCGLLVIGSLISWRAVGPPDES